MILAENKLLFKSGSYKTVDRIPVGNWQVKFNQDEGVFYLQKMEEFKIPSKIYGNSRELAKRYLNTFNSKEKNLGVALTGLKGTGKSLLAKEICVQSNLPVICIDTPFYGAEFNSFISGINEKAVVYIDEFEKVYKEEDAKNSMLTLLEGMYNGKKLFVFTSNSVSKYSNFLLNRPGRIHYMKNFSRIEDSVLNEIVDENLKNKDNKQGVIKIIDQIEDANIDMVFALVQEMNQYDEKAEESVKYLNIDLSEDSSRWEYSLEINGIEYKTKSNNIFELDMCTIYPNISPLENSKLRKKKIKAKESGDTELLNELNDIQRELYIDINLSQIKINVIDRLNLEFEILTEYSDIPLKIHSKKEISNIRGLIL